MSLIVATGPVAPPTEEILSDFGELVVAPSTEEDVLRSLVSDAVALIVRGGSRISSGVIEAAPRLKVIARSGVGFDEIDVEAASRRGIPIVITPDANAQSVAEGAMTLILCLAKNVFELNVLVRDGRWEERDSVQIEDLEGATLGIVGLGRSGVRLADLARAFRMEVVAHDPYVLASEGVDFLDLPALVSRSAYISLHAPLNATTRGMIDAQLLSHARPGTVLVNLARGGLLRSLDDILEALESGTLGAVGLDVFEPEPPDISHPIFRHPRVILSPHALGLSRAAKRRTFEEMSLGIAAALRGERPAQVANPEIYS